MGLLFEGSDYPRVVSIIRNTVCPETLVTHVLLLQVLYSYTEPSKEIHSKTSRSQSLLETTLLLSTLWHVIPYRGNLGKVCYHPNVAIQLS